MSRTSIVQIMLLQSRRLQAAKEQMDLVGSGGLAADVVGAGVGRDPADRRAAAIARVSTLLTTGAAHTRGLCVFAGGSNVGRGLELASDSCGC